MEYDVFVSYSHAADELLSERVQDGLQRFAKPWWRRRELAVFRDRSVLTADPGLWSSIVEAMDVSRYFLLLAAPEAAASAWVNREVEHWRELHGGERLLILQTDGEIAWDETAGDFDLAASTALPAALLACFAEEPLFVDMRWARSEEQLDISDGRFRDQIAELSAAVHGVPKDALAGEDVRQHRRTIRTAVTAAAALVVLTLASVAGAVFAVRSAAQSRDNARRALSAQQRAISEERRADGAAQLARQRGDEVTHANEQLGRANQSLQTTNQQLESTNNELVSQTQQTEQQREQANANAAEATRNANEAQQNAAAASANAARASSSAAEAEQNAAEAADERNQAIANRDEANRQRDRALAAQRTLEQRNAQLSAANAAGFSRQLAAESLTNLDNLDEALLLGAAANEVSATAAAHDALLKLAESSVGVEGFLRPPGVTPESRAVAKVAVATSADGTKRAEWITDGDIIVWQGARARSARATVTIAPGFSVTDMTFSADGGHVVAWSTDEALIRSWDLARPGAPTAQYEYRCDLHTTCSPVVARNGTIVVPNDGQVAFLDPATLQGPIRTGRLGADGGGPAGRCATPQWSGGKPIGPANARQTETCLSPGGRFAVGQKANGDPVLWDIAGGAAETVLRAGPTPLQHPVISDDDRVAVAASATGNVFVLSVSGSVRSTFAAGHDVVALAVSADDAQVAAFDADGHLSLRRLADGQPLVDANLISAARARLEFSRNHAWLAIATGNDDNPAARVQIVATANGETAADLSAMPTGSTLPLGFAFDRSDHVVVRTDASTLLVWDLITRSPVTAVGAPHGFGSGVLVSRDGTTLAALSAGEKVLLLSLIDLRHPVRSLPASALVTSTRFGPRGRFVGVETNGTLIEWNLDVTTIGSALESGRIVGCDTCPLLAVSPDGSAVATADETRGAGGFVRLERPPGSPPTILDLPNSGRPTSLSFTAGGTYLVLVDQGATYITPLSGGAYCARTSSSAPSCAHAALTASSADDTVGASIDPGGRSISLWSLTTGTRLRVLDFGARVSVIRNIALDGNANELVVLDDDHVVSVWDAATDRELGRFNIAHASDALVLSRDGAKVAVWTQDHRAWIIDARSRATVGTVAADRPALAFSPDGTMLATNVALFTGNGVQLWDTAGLETVGDPLRVSLPNADPSSTTGSPTAGFTSNVMQFANDGRRLVVVSEHDGASTVDLRAITVAAPVLEGDACSIARRALTAQERQRFDPGENLPSSLCRAEIGRA